MSTRANVVITDSFKTELWFYRHSDGYPEGTLPTLKKFCKWVHEGKIRDNANQSAGWLIIIGADEYKEYHIIKHDIFAANYNHDEFEAKKEKKLKKWEGKIPNSPLNTDNICSDWKVGAYEPTFKRHGDIEYLYVIHLAGKKMYIYETGFDASDNDKLIQTINFKDC